MTFRRWFDKYSPTFCFHQEVGEAVEGVGQFLNLNPNANLNLTRCRDEQTQRKYNFGGQHRDREGGYHCDLQKDLQN